MHPESDIQVQECEVLLASPVEYEQCVVTVEHAQGLLFILTDEYLDGKLKIEFGASPGARWTMSLREFRKLLALAEAKLS